MKMAKTEGFDWWAGSRWNGDGAGQSFKLILVKLLTSQQQPLCLSVIFISIKTVTVSAVIERKALTVNSSLSYE